MAITQEPTAAQAIDLFEEVEQKFPHKTLGEETWYLVVVGQHSPITASPADPSASYPLLLESSQNML